MSRSVKTAEENNTLNVREARSNLYNQNVVYFWQRGIIIDYVIVFNFGLDIGKQLSLRVSSVIM